MSKDITDNSKFSINGIGYEQANGQKDGYDDDDDDDDATYGPYASFDQSASEGTFLENQFKTTQLIVKQASGKTITRLKKPRDLYALSKQYSAQMTQRWPSEIQIISKRPNHIYHVPSKPEILYKPAQNKDLGSLPRTSHILGKVVYENSPDINVKYFTRSKCRAKSTHAKPYYRLQGSEDTTLLFESRFESGNLMKAIKIREYDYELWLRFDLYTNKHTQWYYFMVKNAKPGILYRFTIMNFIKPGSLYNDGMRPLMYSESDAEDKGVGWVRTGTKIKYYRNDIKFQDSGKEKFYFSLTWSCTFSNENDTYYFAHCYPYTYSDLQDYLGILASDPVRSKCCKQRVLCRTLAGNYVYVLTITAPTKRRNEAEVKKAVIITARVHPGETNSSWMMKGFLDFLTSNSQDAKLLRENFIFKIVPMLNPDGVIAGNYRCSLAGRDLNRNYKTVLKDSFPPIWHTRAMVRKLQEEREILMYCDLHGHSRKKNIFIYGCENKQEKQRRFWGRVFPAMLAKNAPDKFSLSHCRFKVQKNKEGTGRVFMWNFGISNSFTMEASFCGSSLGNRKGYHFSIADYESMAYQFCDTLLDYYDPDRSKFQKVLSEIVGFIRNAIREKLKISDDDDVEADDINIEERLDLLSEIESDSGGSDSSVSDGLPMQLLHASVPELSRKRRLKTRKERNKQMLKSSKENNDITQKQSNETNRSVPNSAKSEVKTERKTSELASTNSSAKGRLSYTQRGSSAFTQTVPHFVRDRVAEKSKLKKEYLEVLTSAFINSGNENLVNLQDIPHCRFTAGISSHYQSTKSCIACDRCYKSCSEGSDEERKVSGARSRTIDHHPEIYWQQYGSEQNANTVLDLAKRITVYNHRINQSVSRRTNRGKHAPSQGKTNWQHVDKQFEELSLGVYDDNKPGIDDNCWRNQERSRTKGRRHFQIRQEQRISQNGLFSPRRFNNHFEIKRAKSTFHNRLKLQDRLRSSSSDVSPSGFINDIVSYPSNRRLPQLRHSEEADNRNDLHHSVSNQSFWNENSADKSLINGYSHQDIRTVDSNSGKIDRNEISMLKEKMLQCGASGLVNYVLEGTDPRNFDDALTSMSFPRKTASKQNTAPDSLPNEDVRGRNKDTNFALDSKRMEQSKGSGNEQAFSALHRGFSDLGNTAGKTKRILEGIDGTCENQAKNVEDKTMKLERSFTDDIVREGLVTLNVNLNILPVTNHNNFEANSSKIVEGKDQNEDDRFEQEFPTDQLIPEVEASEDGHQLTWVARDVTTPGSQIPRPKPVILNFSGKEATSSSSTYWPKGGKVCPPQLRGQRKAFKESNQ